MKAKTVEVFAVAHDLLGNRGIERLKWMAQSLEQQTRSPDRFSVICTGSAEEYEAIGELLAGFCFVRVYQHYQEGSFNKSEAINWAAKSSQCEYFVFSDVDYLFSPDLLGPALAIAKPGRMIIKRVHNLPKGAVTANKLKEWSFTSVTPFGMWPWSCGAFLLHHKSDFERLGGFDERFNVGAMDWHYKIRFERLPGTVREITRGQILHQWHPRSKDKWKQDARRNEAIARKELGIKL